MPRYKIIIEYDGTPFVGWQFQDNGPSVQGALMAAIEAFSGEKVMVQGAGRTDAGVHALGQVAHFDLASRARDRHRARRAQRASAAASGGGAVGGEGAGRFRRAPLGAAAALSLSHRQPPARSRARARPRLARAAPARRRGDARGRAAAVGKHDFTTFRSTECQAKSPEKTLDRLDVSRVGRGDPHHRGGALVPAQSGALDGRLAGAGRRRQMAAPTTWRARSQARDRAACGPVAPPDGLYLVRVDY